MAIGLIVLDCAWRKGMRELTNEYIESKRKELKEDICINEVSLVDAIDELTLIKDMYENEYASLTICEGRFGMYVEGKESFEQCKQRLERFRAKRLERAKEKDIRETGEGNS